MNTYPLHIGHIEESNFGSRCINNIIPIFIPSDEMKLNYNKYLYSDCNNCRINNLTRSMLRCGSCSNFILVPYYENLKYLKNLTHFEIDLSKIKHKNNIKYDISNQTKVMDFYYKCFNMSYIYELPLTSLIIHNADYDMLKHILDKIFGVVDFYVSSIICTENLIEILEIIQNNRLFIEYKEINANSYFVEIRR